MTEVLEEQGLDDAYIAGKVRQFCEAVKADEPGTPPDYGVQLRGVEMLCRLKNLFKPEMQVEKVTVTYEEKIELLEEIRKNPEEMMAKLQRRLIQLRQE